MSGVKKSWRARDLAEAYQAPWLGILIIAVIIIAFLVTAFLVL